MKYNKNLETELKRCNIPFEKTNGGYYLWGSGKWRYPEIYTERQCWQFVNHHKHNTHGRWKKNLKHFSNSKERTRLKENLNREDFDSARVRDNKENPWVWD